MRLPMPVEEMVYIKKKFCTIFRFLFHYVGCEIIFWLMHVLMHFKRLNSVIDLISRIWFPQIFAWVHFHESRVLYNSRAQSRLIQNSFKIQNTKFNSFPGIPSTQKFIYERRLILRYLKKNLKQTLELNTTTRLNLDLGPSTIHIVMAVTSS